MTESESILPGAVRVAEPEPEAEPVQPEPVVPEQQPEQPPSTRGGAHAFGSLPAYWAARIQNKAWQRHGTASAAGFVAVHQASTLLKFAQGVSADKFRRKLAGLRFEPLPLLDGAISVFNVPRGSAIHGHPQLVSEHALLAGQKSMETLTTGTAHDTRFDGEGFIADVMHRLGLLHKTAPQQPGWLEPTRSHHVAAITRCEYTDMSCFVAPVTFADHAEVQRMLHVCLELTVARADASIFEAEVPRALGANVWQEEKVGTIYARCRVLNLLWVVLLLASRFFARDGNSPKIDLLWATVVLDVAAWCACVGFLVFMRHHGLATPASINLGKDVMKSFLGQLHGIAGMPHHGTNVWNAMQGTAVSSYFVFVDSWIAYYGLVHPLESDEMSQIRPWIVAEKLLGCGAAFIASASLVLGVECLRSVKGMRFALASVRGLAETFGLLLFFGPVLFGVAVQYFLVIGADTDLLVRPQDEQHLHFGQSFLGVLDALLGSPEQFGEYVDLHRSSRVSGRWAITAIHVVFTLFVSLIVANLLIAIVGDSWEQSVLDSVAWRRFGKSSFAVGCADSTVTADQQRQLGARNWSRRGSVFETDGSWPAVLAWVKPVDLDSKADENEGAPWEGRVVAIKNEVSSVKSTVSRVTDGISHLERKLDMHSSMITSLSQQVKNIEASQASTTALLRQLLEQGQRDGMSRSAQ